MRGNSYQIDIRAIHMTKSSSENPIQKFAEDNVSQTNTYICLGHFDTMQINEISNCPSPRPLERIWDYAYKQATQVGSATSNTHILYIIKQIDTASHSLQQSTFQCFWNKESNYTVISRFHCDLSPDVKNENGQDFIRTLEKRCELHKESANVSLSGRITNGLITEEIFLDGEKKDKNCVTAIFYDSLDLGDIIGIFKGDSLRAILELQRHISEDPVVSDDYTYCGISTRLLGLGCDNLRHELNKQPKIGKSMLPYIATRFSIKLASNAYNYLSPLQKYKKYYVLGNEDVVLMLNQHKEAEFLMEVKHLVDTGTEGGTLYTSFNDVITRVGLTYSEPYRSRVKNVLPYTVIGSKELASVIGWDSSPDWLPSLTKLLSAHKAMSENCVTDDLSLLVSPSVKALIQRIMYLKNAWKREYNGEICTFLSAWSSLTEEIYRVENQMVQHPELSPPQSYIPATLLLYDLALIINFEDLLWCIDATMGGNGKDAHRNYAPILVPSFTSETSTLCILDPKQDTEYTKGAPLIITLPIHDLYQPWKMMHVLIHELSHYCGENIRCRKERWECLCQCVTEYILIVWDYYLDYNKLVAEEANKKTLKQAHDEFRAIINNRIVNSYKSRSSQIYLNDIQQYLAEIATEIAYDYDLQLEYRCTLLKDADLSRQLRNIHENGRMMAMQYGASLQARIPAHIAKCIVPLFKECFADIVMILLLNCSFDDYYRCIYKDEYSQFFPYGIKCEDNLDSTMQQICEKHADRLAIVTAVLKGTKNHNNWAQSQYHDSWIDAANEKVDNYLPNQNSEYCQEQKRTWVKYYVKTIGTYALAIGEVDKIYDYLKSCVSSINNALSNLDVTKAQKNLVAELNNSKDGSFNWNKMNDYIKSSKKFLAEWCGSL